VAVYFYRTPVEQGYVTDYGKSQAGTAGILAPAAVNPVKPLKDAVKMFRGNAGALVLYRNNNFPFPPFRLKEHR
jgi:hypothetical protein